MGKPIIHFSNPRMTHYLVTPHNIDVNFYTHDSLSSSLSRRRRMYMYPSYILA